MPMPGVRNGTELFARCAGRTAPPLHGSAAARAGREAAHITPDSEPDGEPVVSNGIALCKLHHAAFDRNILGIRPDYIAEIRMDVLEEVDGPMLRHGLQEMHGVRVYVPRSEENRPNVDALAKRYERFRAA